MTRRPPPLGLLLPTVALAGPLLAGMLAPALSADLGNLKQISARSPFSSCTADQLDQQVGKNYPQSEIEPFIFANPANPQTVVAAWQQDRFSNGGARGTVAGLSLNGGYTWQQLAMPGTTSCDGGKFKRASDPWVGFSPDGTGYVLSLVFDPDLPSGSFGPNAIVVNRSTDGGRSWKAPTTLIEDGAGQVLNDKDSLTADPTDSRYVYAAWDRLRDFTLPPAATAGAAAGAAAPAIKATAGAGDGVVAARQRIEQVLALHQNRQAAAAQQVFFKGPTYLARTTDGGKSWKKARKIYDPGDNAQTINNIVVVPPSGEVLDMFTEILSDPVASIRIGIVRSTDKGATFGTPSYAADIVSGTGVVTPDTGEPVRDASILFDPAVDAETGNLYLVWQDVRFDLQTPIDAIAFAMSSDGGATWSEPVRINQTPNSNNPYRKQAFIPAIEVGLDGELVVTYYDFRFDKNDGQEATDNFAVFCQPRAVDCTKRANWGGEKRLTEKSFNMRKAPVAGGFFLGDYMGLAATAGHVFPAFGSVVSSNETSIFTRRIDLGGVAKQAAAN